MATVGIFNTSAVTQDLAKKSFAANIARLMPMGSAPLFALTSFLKDETAMQFEHGFFTKTMIFPYITLNGAISTNTAGLVETWTVAATPGTASILQGMILQVPGTNGVMGENVLVLAVNSNTSLTVQRGFGDSARVATIADTTSIYQVGNAYEESSLRPGSMVLNPIRITNITQIFRNTWAISDSLRATQMIAGETNIAESRMDCAAFHATAIESAIIFGQKYQGTRNGQPVREMDGLISMIEATTYYPPIYGGTANKTVLGSTTNYTQLETALDPVFNQTTDPSMANERLMLVGGTSKKVLNNIGRLNGQYQLVDGQTNWGLQFTTFKTSRGTFRVIEHPLFNTNSVWAKMALVIDLPSFALAYLGDRKTQNREFNSSGNQAQDNGIDAVGGTLTTECTATCKNPPANAVIYNFTAAAAG